MKNRIPDPKRTFLILLAFFCGGAVPIQLVTLSFGYAQYLQGIPKGPKTIMVAHQFALPYLLFVYLPAFILLGGIIFYSRNHYPDVFRRIVFGLSAGLLGTVGLDAFRLLGVVNGWLPGDTIQMFGKMATGSKSIWAWLPAGFAVHYLNGADFGLFFAFVWGKQKSYARALGWGILWLLIMELGMMTAPPMAPAVGLFGVNHHWPGLFLITLVAHISSGATMGFFAQFWLRGDDRGSLFSFLRGDFPTETGKLR